MLPSEIKYLTGQLKTPNNEVLSPCYVLDDMHPVYLQGLFKFYIDAVQ